MTTLWRDLTLRVPNVAVLSDHDLRTLFPNQDGRWSEVIERATEALGAEALDLNSWWADTPQAWSCPCCQREKYAILRLSKDRVLLAHLHEHHDHLQDLMGHRLQGHFGAHWTAGIPPGTYHLEHLGSRLLTRFDPTVVCADCNIAEAKVKSGLPHIHRYFSFRPSEMRAFIGASPNADHSIDLDQADALWRAAEVDFEERLNMADLLVDKIVRGAGAKEHQPPSAPATSDIGRYLLRWFWSGEQPATDLPAEMQLLAARSIAREGVGRRVRSGPKPADIPTEADVAGHDGGASPLLWAELDANWLCDGCGRDRKGLLRRSKNPKRRWSGGVRRHREYQVWTPSMDDDVGGPPMIIAHTRHLICEDCATLGPGLKQRDPMVAGTDFHLYLDDMRASIEAADHAPHAINWTELKRRVLANTQQRPLVREYERDLSEAVSARGDYLYFLGLTPDDSPTAWRRTLARHRHSGGSTAEVGEYLTSLIERADRLEPRDRGQGDGDQSVSI